MCGFQQAWADRSEVDANLVRPPGFAATMAAHEERKRKLVDDGAGWRDTDLCPACGCGASTAGMFRNTNYARCFSCEAVYLFRVPADPADIYDDENYALRAQDPTEFVAARRAWKQRRDGFGAERVGILDDALQKALRLGADEMCILDVGCGDGWFLAAAKDTFGEVVGQESSPERARRAMVRSGVRTWSGNDLAAHGEFHAVTMFDVLEHLPDPVGFLRDVNAALVPGGVLLVFTPNWDSLSVRLLGGRSPILDGTEHLCVYHEPSLQELAERAGFTVERVWTRGLDVLTVEADYANRFGGGRIRRSASELQAAVDAAGCGDGLRAILRKG